jgi:nicotinamide phosphoribosyltransferase
MSPEGTEIVQSYFEARKGAEFPETVFFGLQYFIKEYLVGKVITKEKIDFAEKLSAAHFGNDKVFNRERWDNILEKHDGILPIKIKAVPEGTPVTIDNVMMIVENTDPEAYWLTNHLETLLTQVWHASTVATLSRAVKKDFKKYIDRTVDDDFEGIDFMLHDFGKRGVSSMESAGVGGLGHLINFKGTDTVIALETGLNYYNADINTLAFSVLATEHSIMTALLQEGEEEVIEKLLTNYPDGILSIVIDSYDWRNCVDNIMGQKFKDLILKRNGVTVFRPDSGDPVTVMMELLEIVGKRFGYEVNDKGYKVLNPKVRLIWGDGIDRDGINDVLENMANKKWSVENALFGMGGGLQQKVNRDTQRFAFKCSAARRDGVWHDVFKDPIDGSKKSKRGRLKLVRVKGAHGSVYKTVKISEPGEDMLRTVFQDGKLLIDDSFDDVRKRASL